jgi:hypothetical protein
MRGWAEKQWRLSSKDLKVVSWLGKNKMKIVYDSKHVTEWHRTLEEPPRMPVCSGREFDVDPTGQSFNWFLSGRSDDTS